MEATKNWTVKMPTFPNGEIKNLDVKVSRYYDRRKGNLRIDLNYEWNEETQKKMNEDPDFDEYGPYCVCTKDIKAPDGYVCIKTHDENYGVKEALTKAGIITGQVFSYVNGSYPIVKLTDEFVSYLKERKI